MKTQIVADTHGGSHFFDWAKQRRHRIIVAGDYGYEPDINPPSNVFFIAGNHDYHEKLNAYENHYTNGSCVVDEKGRRWLFIGGADSIDRTLRQKRGRYWSEKERLTETEVQCIIQNTKEEIYGVISHTCPTKFVLPVIDTDEFYKKQWRLRGFDVDDTPYSRLALEKVLDELKPKAWVFGHFHCQMHGATQGCEWWGLDMWEIMLDKPPFLEDL